MATKKKSQNKKPPITKHHHGAVERLSTALQPHLSDDLLKPALRKKRPADAHPTWGHCYVSTEALYYALGGQASGFTPASGRDELGIVHWWLEAETEQGMVRIDVTAAQYTHKGGQTPYEAGLPYARRGFLTNKPSKRAQKLLTRAGLAEAEIQP